MSDDIQHLLNRISEHDLDVLAARIDARREELRRAARPPIWECPGECSDDGSEPVFDVDATARVYFSAKINQYGDYLGEWNEHTDRVEDPGYEDVDYSDERPRCGCCGGLASHPDEEDDESL